MKKKGDPAKVQNELIMLYRKALFSGLSLKDLDEKVEYHAKRVAVTDVVETEVMQEMTDEIINKTPKIVRVGAFILPALFLSIGLYLVGSAVFPILSYYVSASPDLRSNLLTEPIPKDQILDITPIVIPEKDIEQSKKRSEPKIITETMDYTNLSNWFENVSMPNLPTNAYASETTSEYTIDIPELKISNAVVKVGGTNLNDSLIAYPGTALPGELGSPVIFGHSVLRQFYNPSEKNPQRYNSIFSTIMTLKKGDKIYVTSDGVKYTYVVQDKTEVKPEDVYILNQEYGSKKLKLVTCTPEGTYLRRGVVTTQLIKEE